MPAAAATVKFVSLFTGIGGMDLGLERAGWECVAQVEWDDWCNLILEKHWPDVPKWRDIYDVRPDDLPDCDAVVGGFPCQPVSLAGKGLVQADERWLWPEMFRIIRHVRPRIVVVENVAALTSRGLDDVLGDLASIGYDAEWQSIPAAAVGAPHLRWRIFIVAYPSSAGVVTDPGVHRRDGAGGSAEGCEDVSTGPHAPRPTDLVEGGAPVADADIGGLEIFGEPQYTTIERPLGHLADRRSAGGRWERTDLADTEKLPVGTGLRQSEPPGIGRGRPGDGGSQGDWWAVEPDVGRVAHGIPRRVDRLRGLGNAVVPQVAEWIGKAINRGYPAGE